MTAFEKWSVLSTSAATAATGTGYLWVKYFMAPSEPWAVINHPLQPWLLKAHIVVAPLLVFAVGMIAVRHVWQHYRRQIRLGRRSGIAAALSAAPMVFTGYLVQVVTAEGWLEVMAYGHIATSVVFCLGLAAHAVVVLRRPAKSAPAAADGAPGTYGAPGTGPRRTPPPVHTGVGSAGATDRPT